MTDPKHWPTGVRVEVDGQPWSPWRTLLFMAAFGGLVTAIWFWRKLAS